MRITTRPATEADTEFARRVHHAAYRDVVERQFGPWDEAAQDGFFARDWRDSTFAIVLADGTPCGYACVEDRSAGAEADVHVRELVIAPQYQGRGIGTALLRDAQARPQPGRARPPRNLHAEPGAHPLPPAGLPRDRALGQPRRPALDGRLTARRAPRPAASPTALPAPEPGSST